MTAPCCTTGTLCCAALAGCARRCVRRCVRLAQGGCAPRLLGIKAATGSSSGLPTAVGSVWYIPPGSVASLLPGAQCFQRQSLPPLLLPPRCRLLQHNTAEAQAVIDAPKPPVTHFADEQSPETQVCVSGRRGVAACAGANLLCTLLASKSRRRRCLCVWCGSGLL